MATSWVRDRGALKSAGFCVTSTGATQFGIRIAAPGITPMREGKLRLRVTQTLSGSIDGIHLGRFRAGYVYDVGTTVASYLLAIGAAEPVSDETPVSLVLPDILSFSAPRVTPTEIGPFVFPADAALSEAAEHPRRLQGGWSAEQQSVETRSKRERAGRTIDQSLLEDCSLPHATRLNTMFVGSQSTTERVLALLGHMFEGPVLNVTGAEPLPRVPPTVRTLIVDDVDWLSHRDQTRMMNWLDHVPSCQRVISTARAPLLAALANETFLDGLYYRLNTIYIDFTRRR